MTDLRTLLHQSAPVPSAPLDMAAVRRLAARRRSRRIAGWLGLAGLTLGLGVPGGAQLVTVGDDGHAGGGSSAAAVTTPTTTSGGGRSSAATLAAGGTSASPKAPIAIGAPGAPTAVVAGGAGERSSADGGAGPEGPGAAPTLTPSSPTTTAPAYPAAASCWVDNRDLGPSEQRSCRFTATAEGGTSRRPYGDEASSPHGQVFVTRYGTTTVHPVVGVHVFAGDVEHGCEDLFIQPGDLVEVVLTNNPGGTREVETIGAGHGWECYGDAKT